MGILEEQKKNKENEILIKQKEVALEHLRAELARAIQQLEMVRKIEVYLD